MLTDIINYTRYPSSTNRHNNDNDFDFYQIIYIAFIVLVIAIAVAIIKNHGFAASAILGKTMLVCLCIMMLSSLSDNIFRDYVFIIIPICGYIIYVFFIAWIVSLIRNHSIRKRMYREEQLDLMRKQNEIMIQNRTEISSESPMDTIERLAKLKEAGALTEEEFERKKKELLERI